jgi:hypothetical protein
MWIVFRDPNTVFLNLDKYIYELVSDQDILKYQDDLKKQMGGYSFDILENVYFLQPFLSASDGQEYYIRKFEVYDSMNKQGVPSGH